ncbi:unnamed protein product, partial [Scytosiphon promiscuus]
MLSLLFCNISHRSTFAAHLSPFPLHSFLFFLRFGFDSSASFVVPGDVKDYYKEIQEQGAKKEKDFEAKFAAYECKYPELAKDLRRRMSGELPAGWKDNLPKFSPEVCPRVRRE